MAVRLCSCPLPPSLPTPANPGSPAILLQQGSTKEPTQRLWGSCQAASFSAGILGLCGLHSLPLTKLRVPRLLPTSHHNMSFQAISESPPPLPPVFEAYTSQTDTSSVLSALDFPFHPALLSQSPDTPFYTRRPSCHQNLRYQ